MQLFCRCLNVRLSVEESSGRRNFDEQSNTANYPDGVSPEEWCQSRLIGEGAHFVHSFLVETQKQELWRRSHCLCCDTITHWQNISEPTIVLRPLRTLLSDPNEVDQLRKSNLFSEAYQLVLDERWAVRRRTDSNSSSSSTETSVQRLQQLMVDHIIHEEKLMEKRLREIELAERRAFAQVELRCQRECTLISSLFQNACDNCSHEERPRTPEMVDRLETTPQERYNSQEETDIFELSSPPSVPSSEVASDEEDSDGSTADLSSGSAPVPLVASLPISVSRSKVSFNMTPRTPPEMCIEDIARSMQEIASSLRPDDPLDHRPRPRVNTMDRL